MALSHKKYLVDFYYLLISKFNVALHGHDNKLPLRTKSHIGKNKTHRQQRAQPAQKDMQGEDGSAVKSTSWTPSPMSYSGLCVYQTLIQCSYIHKSMQKLIHIK